MKPKLSKEEKAEIRARVRSEWTSRLSRASRTSTARDEQDGDSALDCIVVVNQDGNAHKKKLTKEEKVERRERARLAMTRNVRDDKAEDNVDNDEMSPGSDESDEVPSEVKVEDNLDYDEMYAGLTDSEETDEDPGADKALDNLDNDEFPTSSSKSSDDNDAEEEERSKTPDSDGEEEEEDERPVVFYQNTKPEEEEEEEEEEASTAVTTHKTSSVIRVVVFPLLIAKTLEATFRCVAVACRTTANFIVEILNILIRATFLILLIGFFTATMKYLDPDNYIILNLVYVGQVMLGLAYAFFLGMTHLAHFMPGLFHTFWSSNVAALKVFVLSFWNDVCLVGQLLHHTFLSWSKTLCHDVVHFFEQV